MFGKLLRRAGASSPARTARTAAVAVALTSAAVMASPSIAAAATPASPNMEHFRLISIKGAPGSIIIRGVYDDGGTDYSQQGQKDLAVFHDGAFTINHPGGKFTYSVNPKTCIGKINGTGKYTISDGAGIYRGITGAGSYVLHGQVVLKRNSDGSCNFDAKPSAEQDIIRANGSTS